MFAGTTVKHLGHASNCQEFDESASSTRIECFISEWRPDLQEDRYDHMFG